MTRPDWDEYFLEIAGVVGSRSTCTTPVGAVFVDTENRIISTGYNGAPSGMPHCIEVGCDLDENGSCQRTLHAENNALLYADSLRLRGAKLYTTISPCLPCAKQLVVVRIKEVHFVKWYRNNFGANFLLKAGIHITSHERDLPVGHYYPDV